MRVWLGLLRAEFSKLQHLAVLRAVALSLLIGPGVIVVVMLLFAVDIREFVASPVEVVCGSVVLLAAVGEVVLSAALVGREFDQGTVRVILLRGAPRAGFLLAKVTAIVLTSTVLAFLAALLSIGETILAGWGPTAANGAVVVARVLGIVPLTSLAYIGFTVLGVILGRSIAAGMLAGLALFLGDFLLTTLGSRFPLGEWLPVANLFALLGETFGFMLPPSSSLVPGEAIGHLVGFGAVIIIVGLLLFEKTDLHY